MPDGSIMTIGSERFRCPEVLYDPRIIGKEIGGLQKKNEIRILLQIFLINIKNKNFYKIKFKKI